MSDLLGKRIGHFRVVDIIGKGGMGEVYVGYDETLERKVALKSIRAEQKLHESARIRFLREARVLSQLAHPNICQIFDYVEGEDADLLVLELIRGKNLSRAMKDGLEHRQKLKIARQIAEVLVAAHTSDIVHRDLKPDNVMLTDEGEVKVLDFGLSRTVVDESTDAPVTLVQDPQGRQDDIQTIAGDVSAAAPDYKTRPQGSELRREPNGRATRPVRSTSGSVTMQGAIMGTPGYMSPEQAAGENATAASDMYSFGLLLQELFTGKRPFESGPLHEMIRRAHEGITVPVEGIDPDLTALINRLKSVAPGGRPSAMDTLERIQWIIARPLRRRKRALVAAAFAVITLFSMVMTVQTVRATRAERAAAREALVANRVTQFMVDLFDISDPFGKKSGDVVTVREVLDRGAVRIDEDLKAQPEVQARLMTTIGTVYRKLGLFDRAQPQLERAADVARTNGADDAAVANSLFALASLYSDQARYEKAETLFKTSLEMHERLAGADDPVVADVLNNMAALYGRQGKFKEAEGALTRSLKIRKNAFGGDAPIVADGLNNLALLHSIQGRTREAEALYKQSLTIREKAFGADHPRVADSLNNLAVEYFEHGRLTEAEPVAERALAIFEKALGPEHPHVAHGLNNLAEILHLQRKYDRAQSLYERSLAIYEKVNGPEHVDVAYELNYLARLYLDRNRPQDAAPLLQRALAIYEKSVGGEHPDLAHVLFNLAVLEAKRNNRRSSLAYLDRAFPAGAGTAWARSLESEPAFEPFRGDPEFARVKSEARGSGTS